MTSQDPIPSPTSLLTGEQGDAAQFETMKAFVRQYVDVTMGRIKFVAADGAAVMQGGESQPIILAL
jgi:hypothetical protein